MLNQYGSVLIQIQIWVRNTDAAYGLKAVFHIWDVYHGSGFFPFRILDPESNKKLGCKINLEKFVVLPFVFCIVFIVFFNRYRKIFASMDSEFKYILKYSPKNSP